MAQTDQIKEILKRMEEGTEKIYSRYESLIRASNAGYEAAMKDLEADYAKEANAISARAKVELKNTLEKMADSGYIHSGETVQATIASNSDRARALSDLAVQKAKSKRSYESEKAQKAAELGLAAQQEIGTFQDRMQSEIREQENFEREQLAAEKQRNFENALAVQKLNAQKESEKAEEKIQPKKTPYEYVDEIVKRYTTYNKKKGYKEIDRRAILLAISAIVKDKALDYRYRYEMYLYGKSLGYIKD